MSAGWIGLYVAAVLHSYDTDLFLPPHQTGESASARGAYGEGRDRTSDTAIFSRVLYQLSYLGNRA